MPLTTPSAKRQREHLGPEAVGVEPGLRAPRAAALQAAPAEEQQHPAQRDGDRREQDVEGDVGRELHARQDQGVHVVGSLATARWRCRRRPSTLVGELEQPAAPSRPSSSAGPGSAGPGAARRRTRSSSARSGRACARMRSSAMRSASLAGASSSALRSIDSVGSISRRRRSSASVRKISQASSGASKYSRRSPAWWRRLHQPPGLQFLQPHADVGARELQLGDLGVQRGGSEDQRVDLPMRW